jgi:HAD superfamily hydrolase (TIGR01509 family)
LIAALVFDFDGVIVDSERLHLASYQHVLAPRGIVLDADEYCRTYLGYDDEGVFRAVAQDRGWRITETEIRELIARKSAALEEMMSGGDVLYPDAAECLAALAVEFPIGIASGSFRHEIEAVLDRTGLARHIRFIVGSGDTLESKPAPDPYRLAAERHGLPPARCAAVEDSVWGIQSARSAGLKCIGITHTYPRSELAEADVVIDALRELTPALVRSL